uniref:HTH psq-type domain-containing protein n=1 Tax=Chrysemys picta bellii TaxID=8478 RepID=A0A8C3IUF9_CHRPI
MAPKRKAPTSSGGQPKKQRCVPMLEEKLAVLDLLRDCMSIANVAHKYGLNESSIYAIKIQETEIRQAVASSTPVTAKVTSQVRDKTFMKTEKALYLWLEDMNHKCVPINVLIHVAISYCNTFCMILYHPVAEQCHQTYINMAVYLNKKDLLRPNGDSM